MPLALLAQVIDTQDNQRFDGTYERFPVRIGRDKLNDLYLDRPYISKFHANIDVRGGHIFVEDRGSTNGTVFAGQRLARETPVEVTGASEINIGPIVLRLSVVEQAAKKRNPLEDSTILDMGDMAGPDTITCLTRSRSVSPGGEEAPLRQLMPYVEAYRAAWGNVYRILYDHLPRLPPELRANYIKRLAMERPQVCLEPDFQKLARYYGVDASMMGEFGVEQAALAALGELSRTLSPGSELPYDVPGVIAFARRMRDTLEVFLKCFISLRDGHQEFEAEILARARSSMSDDRVARARDAKELGVVLLGPGGGPEEARQLHDKFVDVMSHNMALITGVMEGVKTLLEELSPKAIEEELERRGKKAGMFSKRHEALWKLYEERHADYSNEEKQAFLTIFGPQFSRAYYATARERMTKGPEERQGKGVAEGRERAQGARGK